MRVDRRVPGGTSLFLSRFLSSTLVTCMWLWSWLPQLIDRVGLGRQTVVFGAAARRSSEAQSAYVLIISMLVLISLILIFVEIQRRGVPGGGAIILVLVPWASCNALYVATGGRNTEILVFPLVAVALLLGLRGNVEIERPLRIILAVTLISSCLLGAFLPTYFLSQNEETISNEKAIIGTQLLNGLLPTSNQLGIVVALGLPLILTTRKAWARRALLALAAAVLLWSATRTALASGAVVVLLWYFVRPLMRTEAFSRLSALAVATGLGLAAVIPFAVSDTADFSRRALIWKVSLSNAFEADPFTGLGSFVFRAPSSVTEGVGAITNTGHNLFVSAFAIGGVISVLAVTWFLICVAQSAVMAATVDVVPLMTLVAVAFLAPLEDPFRGFVIAPASFLLLPLLTYCLTCGKEPPERAESLEPRHDHVVPRRMKGRIG